MTINNDVTMPYVGTDYYSENFHPNELRIMKETIKKSEKFFHRNEIEAFYIIKGSAEIWINGSVFQVSEGALLVLMPYHIHGFQLGKGESIQVYRIIFSLGLLLLMSTNRKVYLDAIKHSYRKIPIRSLNLRQRKQVQYVCEEVYCEKQHFDESTETLNLMLVSLLMYIFRKNYNVEEKQEKVTSVCWQILELIQFQHQNPLTIKKVARQLNISEKTVQDELKQLTGVGFIENLNRVRIRNAAALLQFEELSINQISKICGYQTEANFYKMFKRFLKTTPLAFRQKGEEQSFVQTRVDAWEIYMYIQKNFKRKLSLKIAAKELNISEKRINCLTKNAFGKNFKEIVIDYRLFLAKNLLLISDKSIKEVSMQVGFNDAAAFARDFKKYYDQPPKQYILTHKKRRKQDNHFDG